MLNGKTIKILGILICVLAVGIFVSSNIEEKKEDIKVNGETVLNIAYEDVSALSFGDYSFEKNDDKWVYTADEAFPVDEDKIEDLLSIFEDLKATFTIDEVSDLSMYGLDDPLDTITITTSEDTYTIKIGDYSTVDENRYISLNDTSVYLLSTDPLETYDVELSDLILNDEVPTFSGITEIVFGGNRSLDIVYNNEENLSYTSEYLYFTKNDNEPISSDNLQDYIDKLEGLDLSSYATYNMEDASAYGLDNPNLTVNVSHDEDKTFKLEVGENDGSYYFRIDDSLIVYELSEDDYIELMNCLYSDLRPDEVVVLDFEQMQSIDVELDDEEYEFILSYESDELSGTYNEDEIEIDDFIEELEDLEASSYDVGDVTYSKEQIKITINLDNEAYPSLTIEIYQVNSTDSLVIFNNERQCIVSRSDVIDLIEKVNEIVLA